MGRHQVLGLRDYRILGCDVLGELELVGMTEYSDYSAEDLRMEKDYERWLEGRPICEYCLCPIEEKYAYWVDEKWICESCIDEYMDDEHRERVPDET